MVSLVPCKPIGVSLLPVSHPVRSRFYSRLPVRLHLTLSLFTPIALLRRGSRVRAPAGSPDRPTHTLFRFDPRRVTQSGVPLRTFMRIASGNLFRRDVDHARTGPTTRSVRSSMTAALRSRDGRGYRRENRRRTLLELMNGTIHDLKGGEVADEIHDCLECAADLC